MSTAMSTAAKIMARGMRPSGMREIRLCWDVDGKRGKSLWYPRTDRSLHHMREALELLNEHYGRGTHWIVEREQ